MAVELEQPADGRVRLVGELSLATVPGLWPRLRELCNGRTELAVDLGGISRTDSGALVLLLELIGWGRRQGCAVRLQGQPESLRALARLSGVEGLLAGGE